MYLKILSPIKKNLIASSFGFIVQICNQILIIPLFLTLWGVNEYGDWILLTTISSMFLMTDSGLSSVTQNEFCINYAKKQFKTCDSLLTNNFILILIVSILSLIGSFLYIFNFNIIDSLGLSYVDQRTANTVFILMIISVFVKMSSTVLDSIYRANSQAHKGIFIGQINIILNLIAIIVILLLKESMIYIASLSLGVDICILIYKFYSVQKIYNYYPKLSMIDRKLFKSLLMPSITFLSFPISNAIIFQGFTILVNKFMGIESMVAYNTIRTLTSFVKKIVSMIQVSVWPEYSIAYGKKDFPRMRMLHRKAFSIAFPLTIISCLLILFTGEYIYEIWTNHKINFDFSLAFAFCLLLIARNIWDTSNVVMVSTNNHIKFSIYYLIGSIASLLISIIFINIYKSVLVFVYAQLLIDIILCKYVINQAMKLTNDNYIDFIKYSFKCNLQFTKNNT